MRAGARAKARAWARVTSASEDDAHPYNCQGARDGSATTINDAAVACRRVALYPTCRVRQAEAFVRDKAKVEQEGQRESVIAHGA